MADGSPVAIIGGGPAGAMAGGQLARGGRNVLLFDENLAWEKPCGGGITPKALLRYPFLLDAGEACNWAGGCELISPAGRRVSFPLQQKIAIFSRQVLNGMMLERARAAGAEITRDRVVAIECRPGGWRLRTRGGASYEAGYLILACGARNSLRTQFPDLGVASEMMIAAGYFLPGSSDRIQIRFLEGLDGYIWTFPRCDHFSAGIAGKINAGHTTAELRWLLEEFLAQEGYDTGGGKFYAHLIPCPTVESLQQASFCGAGWAAIGDAAGLVDPITGEGLYYAFRSAELVAEAILAGQPERYHNLLQKELLPELSAAAGYAARFYHGSVLGQPVLELMVRLVSQSIHFRELIADLFAGAQAYVSLRDRCYRHLLPVLWDSLSS